MKHKRTIKHSKKSKGKKRSKKVGGAGNNNNLQGNQFNWRLKKGDLMTPNNFSSEKANLLTPEFLEKIAKDAEIERETEYMAEVIYKRYLARGVILKNSPDMERLKKKVAPRLKRLTGAQIETLSRNFGDLVASKVAAKMKAYSTRLGVKAQDS